MKKHSTAFSELCILVFVDVNLTTDTTEKKKEEGINPND